MAIDKQAEGLKVYEKLVSYLESIKLNFSKEELKDLYVIKFNMSGDDIPMRFFLYVNPDKQLLTMHSPMPVKFEKDKLGAGCAAICAINYKLADGDFQIDVRDGEVLYNMSNCYAGCEVGDDLFAYILGMSINIVEEFNDKLLMIAKGMMDLNTLLKELYK